MDGNDFIALAGKLAAAPDGNEATCRTAVSRAYYGSFHVARSFLAELDFAPVGNASVHGFVGRYLYGSGHPDARKTAKHLADLQAARNRADYRLDDRTVGLHDSAMLSVEWAHLAVSALERCQADGVRESIRQAIGEYARKVRTR